MDGVHTLALRLKVNGTLTSLAPPAAAAMRPAYTPCRDSVEARRLWTLQTSHPLSERIQTRRWR